MVAARRCHLTATVWPVLDQGRWVVSDRFADSTLAYQGSAGGVPRADLEALHRLIAGDFAPDLTLILDLPVDLGLARAQSRPGAETRFERKPRAFHEKLRQGFLDIARREPQRCAVIDAAGDVDAVHQAVLAGVRERLQVKIQQALAIAATASISSSRPSRNSRDTSTRVMAGGVRPAKKRSRAGR